VIITGDCLEVMKTLENKSVQTCITSPPYWGLRDYGTATWDGGDSSCNHVDDVALAERLRQKKSMISVGERTDGSTRTRVHDEQIGNTVQHRDVCPKCGAKRIDAQLGLENTPEEYVAKMVEVFREVRRVLRDDGTLWLNLGDSYGAVGGDTHSGFNSRYSGTGLDGGKQAATGKNAQAAGAREVNTGLRPKNLIGIPWRVAFALQSDGWYLRQDIIWHKPNPMPESVTDRCTKSHEYIFLMSKSQKYYFDAGAIAEPAAWERWGDQTVDKPQQGTAKWIGNKSKDELQERTTKNKRSVWTVSTRPFKEAHFATFPPQLIEPCVKAGSKAGDTILDPFSGAGTTGLVALQHEREFIGIELNPKYAEIANRRIEHERNRMPLLEAIR